ncbi:hypothetical protein [Streptomyces sp. NPDC048411]|uniref:hypothetical protein n=1 Tax=Streptomyces sp. NPDC048411 TaxID=3157206 RepID=UPI0034536CFC
MDMFSEGVPEETGTQRIKEAMTEAAEGAPPLPDLVPVALAEGRRRRTRARAAIGVGVAGVVALGVFGATLPSWGTGNGTAQVGAPAPGRSDATASPAPTGPASDVVKPTSVPTEPPRTPVHVEPTPGESSMADLPAAERRRMERFQQAAAALFDTMLPAAFGTVRPVDLAVSRYQGASKGSVFPVVFSVSPVSGSSGSPEAPCQYAPKAKYRCENAQLPGGIVARAVTATGNTMGGKDIVDVSVRFEFGHSTVLLSAEGDDSSMVSAPVTADQLLHIARDPRFLNLVRYADAYPMEPTQESVRGG